MKKKKLFISMLLLLLVLLFTPVGSASFKVQAATKNQKRLERIYKRRARIVKKRLPKKIRRLTEKGLGYKVGKCSIMSSTRKGHILYARYGGGLGYDGGYMVKVRVNLKNGKGKVLEADFEGHPRFRISIK